MDGTYFIVGTSFSDALKMPRLFHIGAVRIGLTCRTDTKGDFGDGKRNTDNVEDMPIVISY